MTEHIFLFHKKTDKFKKNVLIFRLEGSKISICKKEQGKNVTVKEEQGKEETS